MFSHFLRKLGTLFARRDPSAVPAGGLVWHTLPAASDLVHLLPTLFSHPSAVMVKQNLQRTILRVSLPGGVVFVKRSRANTPRAWAREVLRPPKARLEFENAVRLRELGIACAEPLAWAEADSFLPGESAVITREVTGAVPLDEYLSDSPVSVDRRRMAVTLGRLFAAMHAAGIAHPDPHPGNFLAKRTANGFEFVLLDVHAVRFGPPLTWDEARANLVLFNRWFQLRASRTDRARFWKAYTSPPTTPTPLPQGEIGASIEAQTAASNRRFWAARDDRYLGNNRQFCKVKGKGVRGHAVRELSDDLVKAWLADPDAVFTQPGAVLLKDSPSSTVAILPPPPLEGEGLGSSGKVANPSPPTPLPQGERGAILWKRFRLKHPLDTFKNLLRRSEALRSWVFGHGLMDRHLPTARPLFVAHRIRNGIPREGYVAFEVVPDAVELPEFVALASFAELRTLCQTLGRLIRTLHDRGVSHRDLKPANILLSAPDPRPVFIDLVGLAVHTDVPARIRQRDLTRLSAGFVSNSRVSRTLRLRLLLAYLRMWPTVRDDWKIWWRAIATATDRKVLKNLHSGRPLA